jgi:fatty-acyl-CoA synthase
LSTLETMGTAHTIASPAKAWLRALELTAPIPRNRARILPTVIDELAVQHLDAPALLSDRECLTYFQLAERTNQYSRWALDQGVAKGEVVGLLMTNRPEYLAIWLGITRVGGVVALLNTNLTGPSLAHSIDVVSPKHLIVAAELADQCTTALPHLSTLPGIWTHGEPYCGGDESGRRIDLEVENKSGASLSKEEQRPVSIEDRALYIYTSGTTGLPKAANISHARIMQWGHWFAGMTRAQSTDRLYNCLPMYHSVGGVLAPGAILVAGGALVIREKFSASGFWNDVIHWDCSMFQYIGELCRYLLHAAPSANETSHRIRMACGNGLAPEIWDGFKDRFCIPQILEFYAATEGAVSLFNVQGQRGAIGHVPAYLAHRFSPALVVFDIDKGEPARNAQGFCIRCATNEPGEALSKVVNDSSNIGSRFEGYTNQEASESKILRDVFEPGDVWVRTGDLMRKDEQGYFYFVDRVGDTFRWKGENVATSEVSQAISTYPGVKHANVYGVSIPGADGRAGMATLASEGNLDLAGFRRHLINSLPPYARPLFLRVRTNMDLTGTFKYAKADLVRQGFNPAASNDVVYLDDLESGAFTRLDQAVYERIQLGSIRF